MHWSCNTIVNICKLNNLLLEYFNDLTPQNCVKRSIKKIGTQREKYESQGREIPIYLIRIRVK